MNQVWFELFDEIFLTFRIDVGCALPIILFMTRKESHNLWMNRTSLDRVLEKGQPGLFTRLKPSQGVHKVLKKSGDGFANLGCWWFFGEHYCRQPSPAHLCALRRRWKRRFQNRYISRFLQGRRSIIWSPGINLLKKICSTKNKVLIWRLPLQMLKNYVAFSFCIPFKIGSKNVQFFLRCEKTFHSINAADIKVIFCF